MTDWQKMDWSEISTISSGRELQMVILAGEKNEVLKTSVLPVICLMQ